MQAYCMKCKVKREMKDAKAVTMKNGKPATQGVCPACGTSNKTPDISGLPRAGYFYAKGTQPSYFKLHIMDNCSTPELSSV